jgi:hypothetical protein
MPGLPRCTSQAYNTRTLVRKMAGQQLDETDSHRIK